MARISQGRCDTTHTERFLNLSCMCDTYEGNLGPCDHHELGSNGRCAFCDHETRCYPDETATVVAGRKLANDLSYFETRCLNLIEQCGFRVPRPKDIIAVASDAVRLTRECLDNGIGSIAGAGWQDMATAPKDGTKILVSSDRYDFPLVAYLTHIVTTNTHEWRSFPGLYPIKPKYWMTLPEKK